jgi:hypothetical protein
MRLRYLGKTAGSVEGKSEALYGSTAVSVGSPADLATTALSWVNGLGV